MSVRREGLLGLLQEVDGTLLASGAVVFGVQRLVPTYDKAWYRQLQKPRWTPPNWVFPAVWIPLKLMQSVAAWMVFKSSSSNRYLALTAFGAHMLLGNWWNVVFMGRNKLGESLTWMGAFWASIAGTIATFYQVSKPAALLMVPTQIWVTIAAKLNYDIVQLNTQKPAGATSEAAGVPTKTE